MQLKEFGVSLGDLIHEFNFEVVYGPEGFEKTEITKDDVNLANAFGAIIIGFNIRPTAKIKEVAEQEKVDIRFYDIIYKLVDDVRNAMAGLLAVLIGLEAWRWLH